MEHILENRQYTGCTVNGKTSTISYKVHKVVEKAKEDYQIIPNTQEPIISENMWLRVQELLQIFEEAKKEKLLTQKSA